jgi:hypothetical protein
MMTLHHFLKKNSLYKLKTYNLYNLILKWWKEQEAIYSLLLSFLPKQFLAILGSSHIENERIFKYWAKFWVIGGGGVVGLA